MNFFRESDLKAEQILEGITLKAISGDKTMTTLFEFDPHAVIPFKIELKEKVPFGLGMTVDVRIMPGL